MMRKRRASYSLAGRNKVRLLANIAGSAYRGYQAYKSFSGGSKQISREPAPLTTQHDFSQQYRKRRPRRGRVYRRRVRRAKRFRRAVTAIDNSMLGSRIHVRSNVGSTSSPISGSNIFAFMNLLSAQASTRELTLKNIRDVMLANNVSLRKTMRIMVQSVCLDISITSVTTNTTPVDLDVYVVRCRKNIPINGLSGTLEGFVTAEQVLPNQDVGQIPVTDAGVALARVTTTVGTQTLGWTPWHDPNFCSYFTIVSKKKILLTPGSTTHLQLKKSLRRTFACEDFDKYDAIRGVTYGYLFAFNSVYNGVAIPAATLAYNWEQYYNVKQLRDSEDTVVIA